MPPPPIPKLIKSSYDICFSPDGKFLASCGKEVRLWSSPDITKVWRAHPLAHPMHLGFSPDSSLLGVKSTSGHIRLVSTATGAVAHDFDNKADGQGGSFLFTEDGAHVVDGSWKGSHIVRSLDGKVVFREEFYPDMVKEILRHPSGRLWFRHDPRSLDDSDDEPPQRLLGRDWPFKAGVYQEVALPVKGRFIDGLTFSPDGKLLAVLGGIEPHTLTLYSFPAMEELRSVNLPEGLFNAKKVSFLPGGNLLVAVGSGSLMVLSVGTLALQRQLPLSYGSAIAFSPTHPLAALGCWTAGEVVPLDKLTAG